MKKGLLLILIVAVLATAALRFFMFTTTLSSPTHIDLYLPKDGKEDKFAGVKPKLTFVLLKNGKVLGKMETLLKEEKLFRLTKQMI